MGYSTSVNHSLSKLEREREREREVKRDEDIVHTAKGTMKSLQNIHLPSLTDTILLYYLYFLSRRFH